MGKDVAPPSSPARDKKRTDLLSDLSRQKGFPNPNPNWVKERTKEEGFGLEENQSQTLTLQSTHWGRRKVTLTLTLSQPQIGSRSKREGEEGKGLETIRKGKNELDPFGSDQTEGFP